MIDTHAHLTDENYINSRDFMIKNFQNDGLDFVFTIGYDFKSSIECVKLAEKYENVYAVIGVHPDEITCFTTECKDYFKMISKHPKVIAIGEIGLDYHYRTDNKEEQKIVFVEQLKLANVVGLPVVIHNRDSIGDMLEILENNKKLLKHGGLFHCFSESVEVYHRIKKLGLKVAFGGVCTFKNAVNVHKTLEAVELDDFVIETDCPYLTPEPFRGKMINQPKFVRLVAEKIAQVKGLSVEEILEIADKNTYKLFSKVKSK